MCKQPYAHPGGNMFGCGQCMPCRINRRRIWTARLMYEALTHADSCFVTLTYNDEHLPEGGTLVPSDLRNYVKRLRKTVSPLKIRFYGVGEYGEQTQRPHYHLALYGLGIDAIHVIADCWSLRGVPLGHVHVGTLTAESARYIGGYVTKKLTNINDELVQKILNGRHPEFARMSNRPGIGAAIIPELADALMTDAGSREVARLQDVPTQLRLGGKLMPLGRYLREKLRAAIDYPVLGFASPAAIKQREELRLLLEGKEVYSPQHRSALVAQAFQTKTYSVEYKYKMFQKEKPL